MKAIYVFRVYLRSDPVGERKSKKFVQKNIFNQIFILINSRYSKNHIKKREYSVLI